MIEKLRNAPDSPFAFDDDEECKTLLFELGIIDKFSKNPSFADSSQVKTQVVSMNTFPSHYILAFLWLGCEKTEDNGYMLFCVPKSKASPAQMEKYTETMLARFGGTPVVVKPFSATSSEN